MGKLIVPTSLGRVEGDVKFMWDARNDREVEAAKRVFEEHIGRGFRAFRYINGSLQMITNFDKDAEQIFVVALLAGG